MCKNIAVFGPTHSGKSTLMGYILCHELDESSRKSKLSHIKKEILEDGLIYHADRKYAYVVDTAADERRDNKHQQSRRRGIGGGSKHIHICEASINNVDCTFFETPGSDQYWIEKDEGVFLGDIGVYVIEISLLLELSQKVKDSQNYKELERRIFSPLYLWKHYKNVLKLVIVISKIDLNYSRFAIETAINIIRSVRAFRNVQIVPISIDIDGEIDCNIYNKCQKIDNFYKGKTLINAISSLINIEVSKVNDKTSVFAHIHRIFEVKDYNYKSTFALRIKVLNGSISEGDKIKIGPIKEKNNNRNLFGEGIVKMLKRDPSSKVNVLNKGEVGGVIFSSFVVDGIERELSEFELKRTSVLYDINSDIEKGNLLYLTVDLRNENNAMKEAFINLKINDRIKIIWFGKLIVADLVGRICSDFEEGKDKWNLILMNYNSSTEISTFLLTMNEKRELIYNNFVLQLPNGLYVKSQITDIDYISSDLPGQVDFVCNYDGILNQDFEEFMSSLKEMKLQVHIEDSAIYNGIYFTNITNINISSVMSLLRKFMRHKNISNYQIDIKSR